MTAFDLQPLTLVLGAAASGKSRHAEKMIDASGLRPVYLATAEALDGEMTAKITRHRERRGAAWRTVEAPHDLPGALAELRPGDAALIDCLTLWLSNRMLAGADLDADAAELEAALGSCTAPVVAVSNELGWGIVPADALSRRFRQRQGELNQRIAALADAVTLVVAGLPLALKPQ